MITRMTPLGEKIARLIRHDGPMPLAQYMHICLFDPQHGYYVNRKAIGRDGDFITAPEISQIFGELIGIWCLAIWQAMGKPERFTLVEAGPGQGTLMADLLRAGVSCPEFLAAGKIMLVETSPAMRKQQQTRLANAPCSISWCENIADTGDDPLILVANEFLDALPVRQYIRTVSGWNERCIGLDGDGQLAWVAGSGAIDPALLPDNHENVAVGTIFEIAPAREAWMAQLAEQLAERGGVALLIDYGHAKTGFGETFQAVRAHRYADALAAPGMADLTSHVDFEAIAAIARQQGLLTSTILGQGRFLFEMGLTERIRSLSDGRSTDEQTRIVQAAERLADPAKMGNLFKVLAIATSTLKPALAGLPPFVVEEINSGN
jgi:NADH dehydrogenase [ubiquinone] 1 alpha subcomplex assembly factor 7